MTTFFCYDYLFDPNRSFEFYYRMPEEYWNEIERKSSEIYLRNSLKNTTFNTSKKREDE